RPRRISTAFSRGYRVVVQTESDVGTNRSGSRPIGSGRCPFHATSRPKTMTLMRDFGKCSSARGEAEPIERRTYRELFVIRGDLVLILCVRGPGERPIRPDDIESG